MTRASFKAAIARQYEFLRTWTGAAVRSVGGCACRSISVICLLRLKDVENALAQSGSVSAYAASMVPTWPRVERRGSRSVLFLHHSYYNFFYLAAALRRRGWDAVSR